MIFLLLVNIVLWEYCYVTLRYLFEESGPRRGIYHKLPMF